MKSKDFSEIDELRLTSNEIAINMLFREIEHLQSQVEAQRQYIETLTNHLHGATISLASIEHALKKYIETDYEH